MGDVLEKGSDAVPGSRVPPWEWSDRTAEQQQEEPVFGEWDFALGAALLRAGLLGGGPMPVRDRLGVLRRHGASNAWIALESHGGRLTSATGIVDAKKTQRRSHVFAIWISVDLDRMSWDLVHPSETARAYRGVNEHSDWPVKPSRRSFRPSPLNPRNRM